MTYTEWIAVSLVAAWVIFGFVVVYYLITGSAGGLSEKVARAKAYRKKRTSEIREDQIHRLKPL